MSYLIDGINGKSSDAAFKMVLSTILLLAAVQTLNLLINEVFEYYFPNSPKKLMLSYGAVIIALLAIAIYLHTSAQKDIQNQQDFVK